MLTKPYRLVFLKYAEPYLSQKDFSRILADAWTQTEAPHNDPNLMEIDEYKQFKELENTVTVYRGVTPYNADNLKGLSWTLNPETAEWFANRFGDDGTVYEAQIEKSHIYAYFSSRNESEIIVDPKYLTDITEYEESTNAFIFSFSPITDTYKYCSYSHGISDTAMEDLDERMRHNLFFL